MAARIAMAGAPPRVPVESHASEIEEAEEALYNLPYAAGDSTRCRRVTVISRDGNRSAVRSSDMQLTIINHAEGAATENESSSRLLQDRGNASASHREHLGAPSKPSEDESCVLLNVPRSIVEFAFSNCGDFLAVADEDGTLHLFNVQHEAALFAYPVIASSASASASAVGRDSISAVAFAERGASNHDIEEDLLVLTRGGVLIRLGGLRLGEVERILASEPSHSMAMRAILDSIQVHETQIGHQNEGSGSFLLGRRYSSALFVLVANHGGAMSVWRASALGNQYSGDRAISKCTGCSQLPDATAVIDAQLICDGRLLVVLSAGGWLTVWDWRSMSIVSRISVEGVKSFTALGESETAGSFQLALHRHRPDGTSAIEVVVTELTLGSMASELTVLQVLNHTADAPTDILLSANPIHGSQSSRVVVSQIGSHRLRSHLIDPKNIDDGRMDIDQPPAHRDSFDGASSGVRCTQELLSIVKNPDLDDRNLIEKCGEKLIQCVGEIGRDLEDSRVIIEGLLEFAQHLRQMIQAMSTTSKGHGTKAQPHIPLKVYEWLDEIANISYKWTTFTLLLTSSNSTSTSSGSLLRRWRSFCKANLLEVLCDYLKRGGMRPASLLWQRHVHEDAVDHIDAVLKQIPVDLPLAVYEKWLQGEVIPSIARHVQRQRTGKKASFASVVGALTVWMIERIQLFAEKEDIASALKMCNFLRLSLNRGSSSSSLRWLSLRLSSVADVVERTNAQSYLDKIERLANQLEHMTYLHDRHSFKISLSVFAEETPTTIAMSMLDRCLSAEAMSDEIRDHVVVYLRYAGEPVDPVLLEYIIETRDSSPTTNNSSEQSRLLAIIDAIADVELRTKATMLFLWSLVPPFSPQVKLFTERCVTWDTRQIDALHEHVRLMEIQDMLTGYGIARFEASDARSGSRLVSHILAQVSRDSVFSDALQLVRHYSDLSVERAALEYFENLVVMESSTSGAHSVESETERRSRLIRNTVNELKATYVSGSGETWRILPIMEETVSMGLLMLEQLESQEAAQSPLLMVDTPFFLRMLAAVVDVFLDESSEMDVPALKDGANGFERRQQDSLLHPRLLADLQRVLRIHTEWRVIVSIKTLRDPEHVADRVRAFIQPDSLFTSVEKKSAQSGGLSKIGKGKRRASMAPDVAGAAKRLRLEVGSSAAHTVDDDQQDDQKTALAFDLHRYATTMGMSGEDFQSLVAQVAAEHGDIVRAVQYSRDLFSRRRGNVTAAFAADGPTSSSGSALKNISLSIFKFTAKHADEIYSLHSAPMGGRGHISQPLTLAQIARVQAPKYSLELLRYAISVCDHDSFEETFVLLKNATLLDDIMRSTQLTDVATIPVDQHEGHGERKIYGKWFREDTMCVLPSAQTMHLATRFAVAEHCLLATYADTCAMGITSQSSAITSQDLIASKRFVSFLVENNADLLSLQVILSMRWLPEDALAVVQTQLVRLLSTVFQSRRIDNLLGLGLMLAMDQRDAFNSFRKQISRENVAKDFYRFQQLAKIGADAARAWQQIAFLHQCVELEGNARWWHYLNLLEIQCDHKAFQSERRDLNYIRTLVPTLLAKSSYDYYTIQEFTRHYQIEDSYPALVYVEALLTVPEATSTKTLEYQDKIVGVLEDIHEQHLVSMLLKVLPKIPGTDYDRLLFVFRLLLEHTSYDDKDEVERRIEVLQVLKVYALSRRSGMMAKLANARPRAVTPQGGIDLQIEELICFHRVMSKPLEVLPEILTTRNFAILCNLVAPLRLKSDELLMLLLKNVVDGHRQTLEIVDENNDRSAMRQALSGSELERLFGILDSLSAVESKITAGEWLAEHLQTPHHKLRSLKFALQAAIASPRSGQRADDPADVTNSDFRGLQAVTRIEHKVIRVKLQLIFAESGSVQSMDETELIELALEEPKELFFELYRSFAASVMAYEGSREAASMHSVADRVAEVLKLPAHELRGELIRDLLVLDAVYGGTSQKQRDRDRASVKNGHGLEDIFTPTEGERRDARDEELIQMIIYIATKVADDAADNADPAVASIEYLVTLARETKPRAGVTFRAKLRAARTVLHLAQSHRDLVAMAMEKKLQLAKFDVAVQELVEYIRHCRHMILFEEHRVPYEIGFVMRTKKVVLVRSLLRQQAATVDDAWVLRSVCNVMLEFDVQAPDLWEFALSKMKKLGMVRSLSRVLDGLSHQTFVRSIPGANGVWKSTLLSPLLRLKSLIEARRSTSVPTPPGVRDRICTELELMVTMLQKCPFLDQIDVAAFVVHLRDLTLAKSEVLAGIDLYTYAVRCATAIPRPSARQQALQRIIQAGAYMQVLEQVCDASVLFDDSLGTENDEQVADQVDLLQAVFTEAKKRQEFTKLFDTPFEHALLEFLAATGDIDDALAMLLEMKRLDAASTLVELLYESHPHVAPADYATDDPHTPNALTQQQRWETLQQYIAASSSPCLAVYQR